MRRRADQARVLARDPAIPVRRVSSRHVESASSKMHSGFDNFVVAQNACYDRVLAELRIGRKTTHWMWFIFSQIAGLGRSETSRQFAISSLDNAVSYLDHPILGQRLRECSNLVSQIQGRSSYDVFGSPDDLKFHASMTLFSKAAPDIDVFPANLMKFYNGRLHLKTLKILGEPSHRI